MIVGAGCTVAGYTIFKESKRYISDKHRDMTVLNSGGRHKEEIKVHVSPEKLDHLQGIIESEKKSK
ncbi:hypothetical protein K502DRAFT_323543 [Neoconidiobolus thromboides FSU 785]|nr:hypothetical protein K502DRAFT_323543 [Neoconidiobolus thromboides FSU 785]